MIQKNKILLFFSVCFLASVGFIYKSWIFNANIIGGDWPYMYQEVINNLPFLPPAWDPTRGNGLGGTFLVYALDSYLYFTGWFFSNLLHIPWPLVYKFFYFGLFLLFSICSVWYSLKKLLPQVPQIYRLLGIFLYVANSYILLVVSGGQMGIALAYSMAPLVLASFIITVNLLGLQLNIKFLISNFKLPLIAGFLFAVQVMFDIRIAYITLGAIFLYQVLGIKYEVSKRNTLNTLYIILYTLVIPLGITVFLHAFWLLPLLFTSHSSVGQLGDIYTTSGAVKFFSFARLENALGLLHPNWPENLFGKVSFMKWEFLILPLLAFSSLLFISSKSQKKVEHYAEQRIILFFALLGLLGAFLAKGANEPFGQIYIWLFEHVPGFVMFRDPTKWYLLVAFSYSVLIPFSIYCIYQWFDLKIKIRKSKVQIKIQNYFPFVIALLFTSYFLYLVHPAFFGQLGGTFKHREVPAEYIALKDKLYNDPEFYRTLWISRQQRFTYSSYTHPSMEAEPLFSATNAAELSKSLKAATGKEFLSDLGVKYIILPYDPYGEIFVDDRKYSQKKRDSYKKVLDSIIWLKKVQDGKISIYENKYHKDLFWMNGSKRKVIYKVLSPTQYEINVEGVKKNDKLIFSENYNSQWRISVNHRVIKSSTYEVSKTVSLNSFVLPEDGSYKINVYYFAEEYYIIGRVISGVALIVLITALTLTLTKRARRKDRR